MAVVFRNPSGAGYSNTELELQEKIFTIYGTKENDDNLFRPDLADQHKVGFFGLDRASQTDVTEVLDLKEMTEVLQILLKDVDELKRDINLAKHVMKADYESKLREKSVELYCRINERVADLEKMHQERVGTVRRAFRQQLSDAIARVAILYNKNLQRKVRQEKSKHEGDADKLEEKYREMQATIQRNESIIHMLKMQIQQLQNKEPSIAESPSIADSERPSAVSPQSPVKHKEVQVEESLVSKTPSVNHEAEALKEELESINQRVEQLQQSLLEKDEETSELQTAINKLEEMLTNERMEKERLKMEVNTIQNAIEQDKANSQRLEGDSDEMIQKQKEEMERMLAEKLRQAQQQTSQAAEDELKARQKAEKEKMAFLYDQEKKLKEELARERAKLAEALKGDTDANKLRRQEQMLREEVARLKKEIERIHKTWEKKFAILQQSLHALKDESYIRQQLQRQAANLHHAAVSYAVDAPIGITPSKHHGSPTKRPLPDIPKYGKSIPPPGVTPGALQEKDYISYTVSAPSGRGTALFSAEENQIMSENDREDIPSDVVPLPERPQRNTAVNSLQTKPISVNKGHVIVVPHVS
ncbi:uncharacterized protein C10orf67, mitochondrial-like isoform X2 [Dreissena polymorpha]|uniref:uncharacterized protein C10orf67, mitochondrial-like isoform X2 n=1 Tax=Dreissena polymorpha TaxID=45954 RepID=UPI0022648069|nr:uncharacterized protein C10orf67, mitochondrial-like isoform X2 [Dreissena polymorpha]